MPFPTFTQYVVVVMGDTVRLPELPSYAPVGLFLGYLTVRGLNRSGIDLSMWSKGLEKFGMSNLIRPSLEGHVYLVIVIAIVITAVIGSIYPSLKAIRLKPVEALRKI